MATAIFIDSFFIYKVICNLISMWKSNGKRNYNNANSDCCRMSTQYFDLISAYVIKLCRILTILVTLSLEYEPQY